MPYMIVYDLVSENYKKVGDSEILRKLAKVRVKATRMLHKLGIQTTESIILVPMSMAYKIEDTIEEITKMYREVLNGTNGNFQEPIIRAMPVSAKQLSALRDVAKRRLERLIDEKKAEIYTILAQDQLAGSASTDSNSIIRYLKHLKREWSRIRNFCLELGIDVEIDGLIDLIDRAITKISD